MVKIWCQPPGIFIEATVLDFKERFLGLSLYSGVSLKGQFPDNARMVVRNKPRDYFPVGSMFIVSDKLKAILEQEQARVEFFPFSVTYRKSILDNFFCANILDVIDCLDPEKTVRVGTGPYPDDIKRLALKLDRVQNAPLFRVDGTILVGVSDRLAAAIENARCSGVVFKSPEEWRNVALLGE